MVKLKRFLLAGALAGALSLSVGGATLAARPTEPQPGAPNCHGAFIGYVSSNGQNNPAQQSQLTGVPVKDLQQFVRGLCAGEHPPAPGQ